MAGAATNGGSGDQWRERRPTPRGSPSRSSEAAGSLPGGAGGEGDAPALRTPTAFILVLCLVASLIAGCNWRSSSEPETRDSLSLSSIDPPSGTRLAPGGPVTFTAFVDYQLVSQSFLSGDRGTITMEIEDQDGRDLDVEVRKTVNHGRGSTSLSDRITVPAAGVSQVKVTLSLIPDALNAPAVISVVATYQVG
jgi:hypothetical protein